MKNNKGVALVSVLITFTVLSILALSIVVLVQKRLHLTASYENLNGAVYAAQAGIEEIKLGMKNRIAACRPVIRQEVQDYINDHYREPGYDPEAYSRQRTKYWIFDRYLTETGFGGQLGIKGAAYNVPVSGAEGYDEAAGIITMRSTGVYGFGDRQASKTITVQLRLDFTDTALVIPEDDEGKNGDNNDDGSNAIGNGVGGGSTGNMPPYSVIIHGPSIEPYSLKAVSRSLDILGPAYFPKGVHGMNEGAGPGVFTFDDTLVVNDTLMLSGSNRKIIVRNDMKVNGNLQLGPDSSMELLVEKGDLIVNGDIIISGSYNRIMVENGDIRCSGSIILDTGASESMLYTKKDLHLGGSITRSGWNSTVRYRELYRDDPDEIRPVHFQFGNINVFQQAGIIRTNTIERSYGTKNDPVVIFSDGDLVINNPWDQNIINIYGIVYATGRITIKGYAADGGYVNLFGSAVSGKKLELDTYDKRIRIEYDKHVIHKLYQAFHDVIAYFSGGGAGGNPRYENVPLVDDFSMISWDE